MINCLLQKLDQIFRIRWLQHIGFWLLSLLILVNVLRLSSQIQKIDVLYALIFQMVIIPPVYINLNILISRFLAQKRYFLYGLFILVDLMLGVGFYYLMFNVLIDVILPGYFFVAYYGVRDIALILIMYFVISTLLKLARAWFKLSQLKNESTRHELNALKAQVNPHFLFNTLSSIYALARKKSDETSGAIMKLSDVLRYTLYETNTEFIPLKKEVEAVQNIIEINRLRFGEKANINFKMDGDLDGVLIAPLVFIPFVENGFKHFQPTTGKVYFLNINLSVNLEIISFQIENSKSNTRSVTSENSGLGLENIRKRLQLLYPGTHTLEIKDEMSKFSVNLQLSR